MPTAASSTRAAVPAAATTSAARAVADVRHLLWFRRQGVRSRRFLPWAAAGGTLLLVMVAVVPAYAPGAGDLDGRALDVLVVLPTLLAGFVVLSLVSATASGGGRELIARDAASIHPISPTTDHLGALLLAPLNIGWLLQACALLGATAYAVGPGLLAPAQAIVVAWVLAATAVAQGLGWTLELVRRVPHGVVAIRLLTVALLGGTLGLQMAGTLITVLDRLPTRWVVNGAISGPGWRWLLTLGVIVLGALLAVALGAVPAHLAAHRAPRDELSVESGAYAARPSPRWALTGLVRTDRASVWRAVPMRRGIAVLALGPGLVAILGDLTWSTMTILPGLVASGGALLFGVNAWCLDGRGGLWRESLPVRPEVVFLARAWVLAEFLTVAALTTIALAAVRAGVPSAAELSALACTTLVVVVQVVGAAMRWSDHHPFAVDLRSSRATPAPPLSMVGYSGRLAVSTTFTSLVFSGLAQTPSWEISVLVAVPFLAWSLGRLDRTQAAVGDARGAGEGGHRRRRMTPTAPGRLSPPPAPRRRR